ncbi:MAG: hypothetical protein WCJ81_09085 [bacterium]
MEEIKKNIAIWVTNHVGTMECAILFLFIGIGSLIGITTNNQILALTCGAISSYVLQLVLLPVIMLGQNIQSEASEARMEKMMKHMSGEIDRILKDVEK